MNKTGIMKAAVYYNSHVCRGHARKKIYVAQSIRTEINCKNEIICFCLYFLFITLLWKYIPNVVRGMRNQTKLNSPCKAINMTPKSEPGATTVAQRPQMGVFHGQQQQSIPQNKDQEHLDLQITAPKSNIHTIWHLIRN